MDKSELSLHVLLYETEGGTIWEYMALAMEAIFILAKRRPVIGPIIRRFERVELNRRKRILFMLAAMLASALIVFVASENWGAGIALSLLVGFLFGREIK